MNQALLDAFKKKYEALSGVVHVCADDTAALTAIAGVCKEAAATHVCCADLSPTLQAALEALARTAGITVLNQPYDPATLPAAIDQCQVGVSSAAFAVAPMGAFVELTVDDAVRIVSTLPRTHIAVIHADTILATLPEAAPRVDDYFRRNGAHAAVTFVSGPSRTGDIEMRLTLGVHGPVSSHVVVLTGPAPAAATAATAASAAANLEKSPA
ncbi:MAG: LutC/YkgG family protein [Planctomycetota bacterium]